MSSEKQLSDILSSLQSTVKLQSALMAKFEQREARMQAAFDQRMQALQNDIAQAHRRFDGIVAEASSRISKGARDAVVPVAREYDRAVSTTSARLNGVSKIIWMWFGSACATLLLVALVGWAVLGYYRRELSTVKDEVGRYESAIPVLKAYYASDAVLCGDVMCVNVDPDAGRSGGKRQYRQAKPRPRL